MLDRYQGFINILGGVTDAENKANRTEKGDAGLEEQMLNNNGYWLLFRELSFNPMPLIIGTIGPAITKKRTY